MRCLSFCLLFFIHSVLWAQTYSRVKMYASPKTLLKIGIAADHGENHEDRHFTTDISDSEIQLLQRHNIAYEVLISDVVQHYKNQNITINAKTNNTACGVSGYNPADTIVTPTGFSLGSMGGFFTYSQFVGHLTNLKNTYPSLVSKIDTIGFSIENRPILAFRVSDNPNVNEPEPEVLYTSIHHAREPGGLSVLIFYLYYLCENYATNPEIQYLLNNRELYFIPMINPDGYVYNEVTNSSGGGMWRKNRRNNGGTFGVDLNRNYGHEWAYDDDGSSPNSADDTFRGANAFSEPETQAVRNFCNAHQFKIALNYHTYSNLLIYPWGYVPSFYTPDSAQFVEYGKLMTKVNNYQYGTGDQTVGYVTNGDSDDWMYGEQLSKPKIMSLTPECGTASDGFWPASTRIIPICKENVVQNLYAARLAGEHAESKDKSMSNFSTTSFYLPFVTTSYGVLNLSSVTISLQPLTANILSVGTSKTFTGLSLLQTNKDSITVNLQPSITPGSTFKLLLITSFNGLTYKDTLTKTYQNTSGGTLVINDPATNLGAWTSVGGWNITTSTFVSAPSSITDSPSGMYANSANTSITYNSSISLVGATQAQATFYAKWDIEKEYDYAQFMVSTNGGSTWIPQCGTYTTLGLGTGNGGVQPLNEPIYDGVKTTWVQETINLSDYLGQSNVKFRFVLGSDSWVNKDGFYFDDFKVLVTSPTHLATDKITSNWKVYPNPVTESLSVQYDSQESLTFDLMDNYGKIIYTTQLTPQTQGNAQIPIENLANGIYQARIQGKHAQQYQKIVVAK